MNAFICFLLLSFKLIPSSYQNENSLIRKLIPNETIKNWEYIDYYFNWDEDKNIYRVIYSSNEPFNLKAEHDYDFYLPNYHLNFTAILYKTSNEKIISANTIEKLKFFLGTIDNLEEALFLAISYGYGFYPNSKKYGSYREEKNGFWLNGYKKSDAPDVIEVDAPIIYYSIFVERNGNVIIKNPIPTP